MCIEELTSCNKLRISNAAEGPECFLVPVLLHKPSRAFGTQPDEEKKWHRRRKSRGQLKTPC